MIACTWPHKFRGQSLAGLWVVSTSREVGITCTRGHSGPHGHVDSIVYSEVKFPNVIHAIQTIKRVQWKLEDCWPPL